jgi:hypothetical protein
LNLPALEKMTATFELIPSSLTDTVVNDYVALEAVKCCKVAMNILQAIYTETEVRLRSRGKFKIIHELALKSITMTTVLEWPDYSTSIPFFRIDESSTRLMFVINTESLFTRSQHYSRSESSGEDLI